MLQNCKSQMSAGAGLYLNNKTKTYPRSTNDDTIPKATQGGLSFYAKVVEV